RHRFTAAGPQEHGLVYRGVGARRHRGHRPTQPLLWRSGGRDAPPARRCRFSGPGRPTLAAMTSSTVLPETFTRAVADLRAVRPRDEITVEDLPPPRRLAPFAYAMGATVLR